MRLVGNMFWLLWLTAVAGVVFLRVYLGAPWWLVGVIAVFLVGDAYVLSECMGWPDDDEGGR